MSAGGTFEDGCAAHDLNGLTVAYHTANNQHSAFFCAFAHRHGLCGICNSPTIAGAIAGAIDDLAAKAAEVALAEQVTA